MKKLYELFLGYILFTSLGMASSWELFGFALGYAIDGYLIISQYPRYLPFCMCCGFVAFSGVAIVIYFTTKIAKKIILSKLKWISFYIAVFLVSIFSAKWWLDLFWFLKCKF